MSRTNTNIELPTSCIPKLQEIRDWNGMTRKELVSRLIVWFCDQDQVIQSLVLGQIPSEIAPDVVEILLLRLKQTPTPEPTTAHQHTTTPSSHVTSPYRNHTEPNIQITIPNRQNRIQLQHNNHSNYSHV